MREYSWLHIPSSRGTCSLFFQSATQGWEVQKSLVAVTQWKPWAQGSNAWCAGWRGPSSHCGVLYPLQSLFGLLHQLCPENHSLASHCALLGSQRTTLGLPPASSRKVMDEWHGLAQLWMRGINSPPSPDASVHPVSSWLWTAKARTRS